MSNNTIARVHYFARQFLRSQDFSAEQDYHMTMRRRHNIAHHTWGIVHGLDLREEEGRFFVLPGMAIDGYGRELVLPQTYELPGSPFDDRGGDLLDVWLEYGRLGSDRTPAGYGGCRNGEVSSFYRWQEYPLVLLELPDPAFPNRREPKEVPEGDLQFSPSRTPPDDPQFDWPVFLGQIQRQRPDPTRDYVYSIDTAGRPYAGLVGEEIRAPSSEAWVRLGQDPADPNRRFGVFLREVNTDIPRLEIEKEGKLRIRGETTVHGNLKMAKGAIAFNAGQAVSAHPWQIYLCERPLNTHADAQEAPEANSTEQTAQDPQEEEPQKLLKQLRIEMGSEGEGNEVVVGTWSEEEERFVECLVIAQDCSVTVNGNLTVGGMLEETQAPASLRFTPEAKRFLAGGVLSGISGASGLAERFYPEPAKSAVEQAGDLLDSDEGLAALAKALVQDGDRLEALSTVLLAQPEGAFTLVSVLLELASAQIIAAFLKTLEAGTWDIEDLALEQIRVLATKLVQGWANLQELIDVFHQVAGTAFVDVLVDHLLPNLVQAAQISVHQLQSISHLLVQEDASIDQVLKELLDSPDALEALAAALLGEPTKLTDFKDALGLP